MFRENSARFSCQEPHPLTAVNLAALRSFPRALLWGPSSSIPPCQVKQRRAFMQGLEVAWPPVGWVGVCGLTALGSSNRARPFTKMHVLWFRASARALHSYIHSHLYPPCSCALAVLLSCSCVSGFPGKNGAVVHTSHFSGMEGAWEAMEPISKAPRKKSVCLLMACQS